MNISPAGLQFIKEAENRPLATGAIKTVRVRMDGERPMIGYGCDLFTPEDVAKYSDRDVPEAECSELLVQRVSVMVGELNRLIAVPLTQGQADSVYSLVHNIGVPNFQESTLLKLLNDGDYPNAADQFLRWDHTGGVESAGLKARRTLERQMFLGQGL